ncbi:cob(I)yrinic acid a,c-diamide adenosyltransferase [Synechococcus sp. M16CYN]|uniref:cob(I)yrinic acid a,c-diamide adenosyltransferase n=1 Tax=Synechococcus sp. M16CYN TaxID=3103139 RepID=UPI0030E208BC
MTASLTDRHRHQKIHSKGSDLQALDRIGLCSLSRVLGTSPSSLRLVAPKGQLQVHTAPYRGSFSGVLSQAVRAAGLGSRVLISQFLKGGVHQGPSGRVQLCSALTWLRPDIPVRVAEPSIYGCRDAIQAVWKVCRQHLITGDLDQLVLDEIGLAVRLGGIDEADLLSTLKQRPKSMDVIITGPSVPTSIVVMADQVTELHRGL